MIRKLQPYLLGMCLFFLAGFSQNLDAQNITFPPDYDGIEDTSPHGWESPLHCENSCDHYGGNSGDQWNTLDNGHPNPDSYNNCFGTGRPYSTCSGFGAGYTDVRHDYCEGEYLIIRTWHAWCDGDLIEHDQRIKVKDVHGPEVTCYESVRASTGGHDCGNLIHIPKPYAHDACSHNLVYKFWFGGEVIYDDDEYFVRNVPEGHHLAKWIIKDDCGNETECEFYIIVTPGGGTPTASCVSYVNVWINDAYSHVYASSFDAGSNNDCGQVYYKVKREDGHYFDDFVKFDCSDHEQRISVTLRVYSVDPGPGQVDPAREAPGGDLYGTYNDCWSEAYVRIKDDPHFYCPPDAWITCDEAFDYIDWSHFGDVHAGGSNDCMMGYYDVEEEIIPPGDCGSYGRHYARIFTVRDHYGRVIWTCTQRIYIRDADQFVICDTECKDYPTSNPYQVCHHGGHTEGDGVEWPCDIHLDECGTGLSPEELSNHPDPYVRSNAYPELYGGQCALLAYNYEDQEFSFGSEGCKKIIRTWTVIDWCQFRIDRGRNENHFYGKWGYIQIIALKDKVDPVVYCEDVIDINNLSDENLVVNGDFNERREGFTSEYSYGRGTGEHTVDRNAAVWSPYLSGFDHTSGDGLFLLANGATTGANVWCQTIEVEEFTSYNFTAWVNNLANPDSTDTNEPNLYFTANGVYLGQSGSLDQSPDEWVKFDAPWLSHNRSSVEMCIHADSRDERGNNFGIDDISLVATSRCRTNPNNECEFWANIDLPEAHDNCSEDVKVHWEIDIHAEEYFRADRSGYDTDPSGYFPIGNHRIKWKVRDDCGNEVICYSSFDVQDCKEPTPYCKNGLATVVMPSTGALTIEAWRFNAGSFDNCTPKDELEFLIRRSGTDHIFRPTITLGCDDITDGVEETIYVDVLVRDASGNEDYCRTYVVFQDTPDTDMPEGICPDVDTVEDDGITERSSTNDSPDISNLFEIEGMELHQNTPNPFKAETSISFTMSKNEMVQLFIYDMSGKIIYQQSINASSGINRHLISGSELNEVSGLMYYRIQTSDQSLTKPMMRIK